MKRLASVVGIVALCVFLLWQCTGAFDDEPDSGRISVFGPWLSTDADKFAASLESFSDDGRGEVRYTGSLNFQDDLRDRVAAIIDTPDLAVVPQPGLIRDLAEAGRLVPFSAEVVEAIEENYTPGSWDEIDGRVYALPYRTIVKSLVWYRPEVFRANGWEVPATLDELTDLAGQIERTDGIEPWCFGIFSGEDTGWPATDWVEDLLLRRAGPEFYDEWVAGNRDFADPLVRQAFVEFRQLVLAPGRTFGGISRVLDAGLRTIDDPLFAEQPGCAMYKQASFGTIWFPPGTEIGPDADIDSFVLPGVDADQPAPLVVAGDSVIQLADRTEVADLLVHLASPDGARAWAAQGGYLSARSSVDPERYYQPNDQRLAEVLLVERTSRFDGSDQFSSLDRDLFFEQITAWVAGAIDYDTLAATMDEQRNPPEP